MVWSMWIFQKDNKKITKTLHTAVLLRDKLFKNQFLLLPEQPREMQDKYEFPLSTFYIHAKENISRLCQETQFSEQTPPIITE